MAEKLPNKRKPISKKTRFEVFKRDKFSCQYCGLAAPLVILHVDHVVPVAEGGDNNILNLVTACQGCNSGKGKRLLSDDAAILLQKQQLDELQEKNEQRKLMLKWRKELKNAEETDVSIAVHDINQWSPEFIVSENGVRDIRRLIRMFGLSEVLIAIDISESTYHRCDPNGVLSKTSWEFSFTKIGGICWTRDQARRAANG